MLLFKHNIHKEQKMDLIKIGAFIVAKKKELNLTQAELAGKLHITDKAVSKWECGKSLPDVPVMIELSKIFNITLNELLSGECVIESEKAAQADRLVVDLLQQNKDYNRKTKLSLITSLCSIAVWVSSLLLMAYLINRADLWIVILTPTIGTIITIVLIIATIILDRVRGFFECRSCRYRFVPEVKAYLSASQALTSRKLKCPKCSQTTWCKHKKTNYAEYAPNEFCD